MADAPVDWTNACARAAALQIAYYALLSGNRETEIRTRTYDAEDLVRFQSVDIDQLQSELRSAQSECAKCQGLPDPNRRFAIGAGYRYRGPGRDYDRRF
jgi:hypothetical protein